MPQTEELKKPLKLCYSVLYQLHIQSNPANDSF